jgi:undecaprenyl-diphosphatase
MIVFWKDIIHILRGTFGPMLLGKPRWNNETKLSTFLVVSIIPVGIVYVIWGDRIDGLFEGHVLLVGLMLLCTALILLSTTRVKSSDRSLNGWRAFLIGVAQAVAVLPGISRSGATISAGLLLGVNKVQVTQFAFLMVLPPVIGAMILELKDVETQLLDSASALPLIAGFLAALLSGLIACRWMIGIVRRGKIAWFAAYCAVAGLVAVAWSQWG